MLLFMESVLRFKRHYCCSTSVCVCIFFRSMVVVVRQNAAFGCSRRLGL